MLKINVGLVSLGCEKNLVDSELVLGLFQKCEAKIVNDLNKANLIIVNTCGFIESAKKEAIDTIFSVLDYQENGAKIVVIGCLVERYYSDLIKEIPEVDLYIPIRDYPKFGEKISSLFLEEKDKKTFNNVCLSYNNRLVSTNNYLAYLKISEGCNNKCAYCAIPLIRGAFRSRSEDEIIDEFRYLISTGRKEICLISQDLTRYGSDISSSLALLLKKLIKIEGDYKIRLLYLYPDEITDELIKIVKESDKIYHYFDIPIQHASTKILKWMGRRGDEAFLDLLIKKIRNEINDVVIRTTIMVGFPHETNKDFNILKEFIKRNKFDHLGAFTFSKEEDTRSYSMNNQVPKKIKEERFNEIMEIQKWISYNQNKSHLGKTYKCVVESYDNDNECYYARNYIFAPDDIDGEIIIKTKEKLELYKEYEVKIIDNDFFDLYGSLL